MVHYIEHFSSLILFLEIFFLHKFPVSRGAKKFFGRKLRKVVRKLRIVWFRADLHFTWVWSIFSQMGSAISSFYLSKFESWMGFWLLYYVFTSLHLFFQLVELENKMGWVFLDFSKRGSYYFLERDFFRSKGYNFLVRRCYFYHKLKNQ